MGVHALGHGYASLHGHAFCKHIQYTANMCMNMHSLQIHRVVADISRIMLVYFVFPVCLFGVFILSF